MRNRSAERIPMRVSIINDELVKKNQNPKTDFMADCGNILDGCLVFCRIQNG